MEYRAVGRRCAIAIDSLCLPISRQEALEFLVSKNFKVTNINLIELARRCVGVSKYKRGAKLNEAPTIVDCSSFTKWLYAQRGIWLPRRSIQQRAYGEAINITDLAQGDLIFTSGAIDYYDSDPAEGVGHVGIATGEGTVIHAANPQFNVIESPVDAFTERNKLRGARRYIPTGTEVLTLEVPTEIEVEVADDLKWIILQSLPETISV